MRVNFCTLDERASTCVCVCVRGNRERAQIKRITDTNDYNTELLLPIFFSMSSPSSSLFIRSLFSSYFQSCFYISITWSDYFTYRVFIANICHIFNRRGKNRNIGRILNNRISNKRIFCFSECTRIIDHSISANVMLIHCQR